MTRPPILVLLAAALALAGAACSKKVEEPQATNVVLDAPFTSDDPEIQAAMDAAREGFGEFLEKAENLASDGTAFLARVHVREGDIREDVWVSNIISNEDGLFTGILGDLPGELRTITMGDEIEFALGQIVEWQYFEGGQVVGAQVARVKRARMSEAEREEFDLSYPFPFDAP